MCKITHYCKAVYLKNSIYSKYSTIYRNLDNFTCALESMIAIYFFMYFLCIFFNY